MIYYDIHTHLPPVHPEDVAIVNTIVGETAMVADRKESSLQSCGIHPWFIQDIPEQLAELREWAARTDVVAIGEAGLDKKVEVSMKLQQEVFLAQARLAEEVQKPLIIHCVKAWDELLAARKRIRPSVPWIIHGFRGKATVAAQLIRWGLMLSFGAYYNEKALRLAWPGAVFAETDNWDGNEDIRIIYEQIAASLNLPTEEVALQIQQNVRNNFTISGLPNQ